MVLYNFNSSAAGQEQVNLCVLKSLAYQEKASSARAVDWDPVPHPSSYQKQKVNEKRGGNFS